MWFDLIALQSHAAYVHEVAREPLERDALKQIPEQREVITTFVNVVGIDEYLASVDGLPKVLFEIPIGRTQSEISCVRVWLSEGARVHRGSARYPVESSRNAAAVFARRQGHSHHLDIQSQGPDIRKRTHSRPPHCDGSDHRAREAGPACQFYRLIECSLSSPLRLCVQPNVGVTHGKVFCGNIGYDLRREYGVMGPSVNLAARLMCKCPM